MKYKYNDLRNIYRKYDKWFGLVYGA